jgi:hypothetical protein
VTWKPAATSGSYPILDYLKRTVRCRPQLCRLAEPHEWQVSGGEGGTPNGDNGVGSRRLDHAQLNGSYLARGALNLTIRYRPLRRQRENISQLARAG